jgi:hypothetical protein
MNPPRTDDTTFEMFKDIFSLGITTEQLNQLHSFEVDKKEKQQ